MDNFTAKPPAETRRGGFAMKITPALIVILLFGTAAEIACAKIWGAAPVVAWAVQGAISGGVSAALMGKGQRRK
jgi:hypothetical protein